MKDIWEMKECLKLDTVYLDYLKSEYIHTAQILVGAISTFQDEMTPEVENDIKCFSQILINLKENLIEAVEEQISIVEDTNQSLKDYLMRYNNDW